MSPDPKRMRAEGERRLARLKGGVLLMTAGSLALFGGLATAADDAPDATANTAPAATDASPIDGAYFDEGGYDGDVQEYGDDAYEGYDEGYDEAYGRSSGQADAPAPPAAAPPTQGSSGGS